MSRFSRESIPRIDDANDSEMINAFQVLGGTFYLSPSQKGCASFQFSNTVPELMISLTRKVIVISKMIRQFHAFFNSCFFFSFIDVLLLFLLLRIELLYVYNDLYYISVYFLYISCIHFSVRPLHISLPMGKGYILGILT